MFSRICHTALTVRELTPLLRFYQNFGFTEVCRYSDDEVEIRRLSLGGTELELFRFNHHMRTPEFPTLQTRLRQPGWQHIAIGTDDIDQALAFAKEKKLVDPQTEIIKGRTGIRYFFTRDPEGNFVEVIDGDGE